MQHANFASELILTPSVSVQSNSFVSGSTAYSQPAAIIQALSSAAKVNPIDSKDAFASAQVRNPACGCHQIPLISVCAQVTQWLHFALSEAAVAPTAVSDVDKQLATSSYLAGQSLTVADVTTFVALHPAFVQASPSQQAAKPHLHRWCAQVQAELIAAGVEVPQPPIPAPARVFKYDIASGAAAAAAPAAAPAAAAAAGGKKKAADAKAPAAAAAAAPAAGGKATKKKEKKEKKKGGEAAPAAAAVDTLIHKCEFKVGTITKVWNHPEADKLYCEEVDCGEGEVRQIASGLRDFIPIEQMQGARVLVFANLKPRPLKGFTSNGMVLCASAPGKTSVEFVIPPEGVPNGEVVTFEGHTLEAGSTNFMAKKKVPEKVLPDLKLSPEGVAMWRDIPFMTSKGAVTAPTLKEGNVG